MPVCKNKIASDPNEKLCGMEIKWKYAWGAPKPEGEKNKPLNLDGSPHWDTCKANPHAPPIQSVDHRKTPEPEMPPEDASFKGTTKTIPKDVKIDSKKEFYGTVKKPDEFQPADVALEYDRNFRVIQFTVSKSRKCSQVTIPNLPDFENREFFLSQSIAVDNPSIDIINKIRQVYAEIDVRIREQIDLTIMELNK